MKYIKRFETNDTKYTSKFKIKDIVICDYIKGGVYKISNLRFSKPDKKYCYRLCNIIDIDDNNARLIGYHLESHLRLATPEEIYDFETKIQAQKYNL